MLDLNFMEVDLVLSNLSFFEDFHQFLRKTGYVIQIAFLIRFELENLFFQRFTQIVHFLFFFTKFLFINFRLKTFLNLFVFRNFFFDFVKTRLKFYNIVIEVPL